MAVDNSPATNALNLLNGIDYGAVIGAPLQAAITAQAMAAKSTWDFIQEVGLQTDENGNKSAVNATFTYQRDGELVQLIVPILTIVPIPAIVVTDIEIAFKTNINASASKSTQESATTDIGAQLSGGTTVGWKSFSINADFKANYSSKKDSKASQDSQYSVEYTQDVTVKAAQAGMPAGLATVLNILSNSATPAPLDGDLRVSPPVITLNCDVIENRAPLSIQLINSNGLNVKGADVIMKAPKDKDYQKSIDIYQAPFDEKLDWDQDEIIVKTGKDGKVNLNVGLNKEGLEDLYSLTSNGILKLTISANIDEKPQTFDLPIKVFNVPEPELIVDGQSIIQLSDNDPQTITLELIYTHSQQPVENINITASPSEKLEIVSDSTNQSNKNGENSDSTNQTGANGENSDSTNQSNKNGENSDSTNQSNKNGQVSNSTKPTNKHGQVTFTIKWKNYKDKNTQGEIKFTADDNLWPKPPEAVVKVVSQTQQLKATKNAILVPMNNKKNSKQTETVTPDNNSSS